ncbi:hypothetical protein AB0C59_23400 [Streptomyces sp. NPDC048664]|uniref:hypothetical protein n=1 Tax=Streptomyces sp. NPDC048664 TaxID=3154505 RepID=UPI00342DE43A
MAGRRRVVGALAGCALLLTGSAGCADRPSAADSSASAAVRGTLDRRATALLDRDRPAFLATEAPAPGATGRTADASAEFDRLRDVPLASWSYRLTALHRAGDHATAEAELSYRISGYDRAPITTGRALRLVRAQGRWYVASDKPAKDADQQLWEQGTVEVVRGAHSLVLGTGRPVDLLRAYARLADRAVPAVTGAWGSDWPERVVVLVPRSLDGMAGLLGSPASRYRGIAAVTTGETGAAGAAPADRITLNPDAYGVLSDVGRQVVLTHETTHVATRAHTSAATPLWLSEGYADWVGYRDTGRTPSQVAPELARSLAEGRMPAALPKDADFSFSGDASTLAQAYEGGWMACRLIADHWGTARLADFYRAVGAQPKRAGAVEEALRTVLGTTPESFTRQWQAYLRTRLG